MYTSLNFTLSSTELSTLLLSALISIALGLVIAKTHTINNNYNKSFVTTLSILPLIIMLIIMLVNGSLGTGVAVMGAFSLVRFRSLPGTAKEICSIFAAMAAGLAMGTYEPLIALLFTVIYAFVMILFEKTSLFDNKNKFQELKITVPEGLYKEDIFTDILEQYTNSYTLANVKTTSMGTLFQLNYQISFNQDESLQQFMNELRCRNGNLDINYNIISKESGTL